MFGPCFLKLVTEEILGQLYAQIKPQRLLTKSNIRNGVFIFSITQIKLPKTFLALDKLNFYIAFTSEEFVIADYLFCNT